MLEFSHFDRRHYPVVSVREGYREWLASYETTVEDEMDLLAASSMTSSRRLKRSVMAGVDRGDHRSSSAL